MSDIVPDSIATVDGQELSSEEARRASKRCERIIFVDIGCMTEPLRHRPDVSVYIGGFFLLPWLWLANFWLFWPELRSASDTAVYSCKGPCCQR